MKTIYIFLGFLLFSQFSNATSQVGDILIWKGDTLILFSNPLESRKDIDVLRTKIENELEKEYKQQYPKKYESDEHELLFSTECLRGYVAEWKIINDSIFLSNIFACHDYNLKIDLKKIFPNNLKEGLLFAEWFNEELIIPKGNCIEHVNLGYKSIYEEEIVPEFEKGLLKEVKVFKNRIVKKSKFALDHNPNNYLQYVYSKIMWDSLPDLKNKNIQVSVGIQPKENGEIDSILCDYTYLLAEGYIDTDTNNVFIKEAIRIARLIPDWSVIIQRDKIQGISFSLLFNENQRKRYFLQDRE